MGITPSSRATQASLAETPTQFHWSVGALRPDNVAECTLFPEGPSGVCTLRIKEGAETGVAP
jgi:hypothetical protein